MPTPRKKLQIVKRETNRVPLEARFNSNNKRAAQDHPVSWIDANPLELADMVAHVVNAGDAVVLASTLDGGALVITLLSGNDRKKWYPDDEQSLSAAIRFISAAYGSETIEPLEVQKTAKAPK
jgi:hypothetical protein